MFIKQHLALSNYTCDKNAQYEIIYTYEHSTHTFIHIGVSEKRRFWSYIE